MEDPVPAGRNHGVQQARGAGEEDDGEVTEETPTQGRETRVLAGIRLGQGQFFDRSVGGLEMRQHERRT